MWARKKRAIFGVVFSILVGFTLVSQAQEKAESQPGAPVRPYEEYLDPTVPRELSKIPLPSYEGERYEAEVPDTLDLAEYAREAVNYLTRMLAPAEWDYRPYQFLYNTYYPGILEIGHNQWKSPWFSDCIVMMRTMSGSRENLEEDRKLIGPLVFFTGKDGLCYEPVENRPWAFMDKTTRERGTPFADILSQGRQLRTYATWYQHGQNPLWKQLALKKIDRLMQIAVPEEDSLYFRMTRGYDPWYEETGEGPLIPLGDGDILYDEMSGTSAGYTILWTPMAGAVWYRLTGYEPALELAAGCARYLHRDKDFYDEKSHTLKSWGDPKEGHPTVFSYCMTSMLSYALTAKDQELVKWVSRGIDQWLDYRDPDRTGIALSVEACQIADMIQVGLMLSRSGAADYWGEVDRLLRNSLASMQITQADIDRFKTRPVVRAGDPKTTAVLEVIDELDDIPLNKPLPPGFAQPEDSTERQRGAWFVSLDNRESTLGCCNGHMPTALYLAWDSIVEDLDDVLKVNLLMNRASPWADIESYLPFEGKVVIRTKTDKDNVLIRIPKWTDWNEVSCQVHAKDLFGAMRVKNRRFEWSGRYWGYISIGKVQADSTIVVEFPMKEWIIDAVLPVSQSVSPERKNRRHQIECRVTLKGNTVIDLSEDARYPMHTHEKYRVEKAGTKKVNRFVSNVQLANWW